MSERPFSCYLWHGPALTPEKAHAVRAAVASGCRRKDLADAYGVSLRTIDRYLSSPDYGDWHRTMITVGGWRAVFAFRDEAAPRRVGPWIEASA